MGYNSLYCSNKCRTKAQAKLPYNPEQRNQTYIRVKSDPDRYALHLRSVRESRTLTRQWLAEYKLSIGCIDGGYKEYACALQLDHESDKTISIANARSSIERLKKEIEDGDCKVRCANCHAVQTWKRKRKKETN